MAIAMVLFILAIAALAPFYGADSRRLDSESRTDWYPAGPTSR